MGMVWFGLGVLLGGGVMLALAWLGLTDETEIQRRFEAMGRD